eukprot:GHVS01050500.1.p1 GENE.GHVS01050500.1~~GHVS01050500.1.p1  ORF type:complete len:287 (+),score=19.80 GHVS01050500.1:44-862(+)
MSNTDYADKIDVLGGLLGMSTELTCGLYRDLVETRKRFANVSDPSEMVKLIHVNAEMSRDAKICWTLAKTRYVMVHRIIARAAKGNIRKMVRLIKDVPSGIGFHKNVVNCLNWWSTERAWDEINRRARRPHRGQACVVEDMMWPLYNELVVLLVDDKNTRIKVKEDFILEAFRQIDSETPSCDFESKDWEDSTRGRVSVILEVKAKMHKTLKELLLRYMSENKIQNGALEELANGETPKDTLSAAYALVTWKEQKQFLFTGGKTKGPTAEKP